MLNKSAQISGKTRTFIIKLLMQRVMSNSQKLLKSSSRVRYQERDAKENWCRLHIIMNEYEYEYYFDMRKFYKMSVSLILAYAVRKYLDEIVNKLLDRNNSTDKYFYKGYIFMKETLDGVTCWKTYWGIPLKLPTMI